MLRSSTQELTPNLVSVRHLDFVTAMSARPTLAFLLALVVASPLEVAQADPTRWAAVGHQEGEIDLDTSLLFLEGTAKPAPATATWQQADTRLVTVGAGYAVGGLGPFLDCYARVEGGFLSSASELAGTSANVPPGTGLFGHDRGGLVRGLASANVVRTSGLSVGLFLEGTLPVDIDRAKFSTLRLHLFGVGGDLEATLTAPNRLLSVRYRGRSFVGSGASEQHRPQLMVTNLLRFEAARWVLPWPVGLALGPHLVADLTPYRSAPYAAAYASQGVGEQLQQLEVSLAVMPYVKLTRNVAFEGGYRKVLVGVDVPATQVWSASLRTAF